MSSELDALRRRLAGIVETVGFDYRKLLVAYMSHIIGRDGSSQIELSCPFNTGLDALSEDERAELRRLESEARETY